MNILWDSATAGPSTDLRYFVSSMVRFIGKPLSTNRIRWPLHLLCFAVALDCKNWGRKSTQVLADSQIPRLFLQSRGPEQGNWTFGEYANNEGNARNLLTVRNGDQPKSVQSTRPMNRAVYRNCTDAAHVDGGEAAKAKD
jgi:hypothetical protein